MKHVKLLALGLALAIICSLSINTEAMAQQQANIGVFDLQKALNDSTKGKAARKSLETKFKDMQSKLQAKEKNLTKLNNELKQMAEKRSGSQEDFRKKGEDLNKQLATYNEDLAKYNNEMRTAEENALKPLVDKAVKAAGDLGRKRGYILVLETQQAGVIFALDTMDMTAEIVKAIDGK